jgi:peptidoglycan/LPS O-acetylase OafA/YrhL
MTPMRSGLFTAFVLEGFTALLVLLPAVFDDARSGLVARVLRLRSLAWIGLVSYAFYLYHPVVIEQVMAFARHEGLPHPFLGVLAVTLLASCACAALSFYLVERPMLRLKRVPRPSRLRGRLRGEPAMAEVPEPLLAGADDQVV